MAGRGVDSSARKSCLPALPITLPHPPLPSPAPPKQALGDSGAGMGAYMKSQRTLEINPRHPLIKALLVRPRLEQGWGPKPGTGRPTDRPTDRQTDRQAGRQTGRHIHTHTHTAAAPPLSHTHTSPRPHTNHDRSAWRPTRRTPLPTLRRRCCLKRRCWRADTAWTTPRRGGGGVFVIHAVWRDGGGGGWGALLESGCGLDDPQARRGAGCCKREPVGGRALAQFLSSPHPPTHPPTHTHTRSSTRTS